MNTKSILSRFVDVCAIDRSSRRDGFDACHTRRDRCLSIDEKNKKQTNQNQKKEQSTGLSDESTVLPRISGARSILLENALVADRSTFAPTTDGPGDIHDTRLSYSASEHL